MSFVLGDPDEPCPPCVKKILNNGGFIAALAPVLAARTVSHPIRVAALHLGEVAAGYSKMLTAIGVSVKVEGDWEGCEQAQLLISWIGENGPSSDVTDKVSQMNEWAATIWAACAELAAGKMPK